MDCDCGLVGEFTLVDQEGYVGVKGMDALFQLLVHIWEKLIS